MLDEEMDHIIRDAAANHHPPYNDKAWEMMEKKLDKHLPQKRDRRKFIFFLLFFLLLGGVAVFTIFQNDADKSGDNKQVRTNEKTSGQPPTLAQQNDEQGNQDIPGTGISEEGQSTMPDGTTQKTTGPGNSSAVTATQLTENTGTSATGPASPSSIKNFNPENNHSKQQGVALHEKEKPGTSSTGSTTPPARKNVNPKNNLSKEQGIALHEIAKPAKNKIPVYNQKGRSNARILAAVPSTGIAKNEDGNAMNNKGVKKNTNGKLNISITAPVQGNHEVAIKPTVTGSETEPDLLAKTEEKRETPVPVEEVKAEKGKDSAETEKTTLTVPDKKKPKKNMAGNFGITVSAGPDMSFISLNNPGKINMTYGAGISYHFGKRFTVRSGFYVTRKKYTSTPEQYNGVIYPNLIEIGADCKVYEIPLSLSYHFWQRKNHNWFGNIGLSSILMKKEDYDYRYKTATGYAYNYKHSVKNENNHYFGVLTLSGGYQYHFSKRISMQAEPYIQLPLAGVGLGKIKLNSTGVLFTLTVKPFAK